MSKSKEPIPIFNYSITFRCNLLFSQRAVFLFHNCHVCVTRCYSVRRVNGFLNLALVLDIRWDDRRTHKPVTSQCLNKNRKIDHDHLCHLALLKRYNGLVKWGTAAASPVLLTLFKDITLFCITYKVVWNLQTQIQLSITYTRTLSRWFLPGILSSPLFGSAGLAAGSGMGSACLLTLALSGEDLGFFEGSVQVGFLPSWSWLVYFSCWQKGERKTQ